LTEPKPIQSCELGRERFDYAEALVGTDEASTAALAALKRSIEDRLQEVLLEPGDLLILDNRHLVHGRREIRSLYDGSDRWLQRILVRDDSVVE